MGTRPSGLRDAGTYDHLVLKELLQTSGVNEVFEPGSRLGIMALHGGLEAGTFEIARDVAAATGAGLYAVVQPEDLRWHVPSIRFDPTHSRKLRRFLDSTALAVSLHGFGRDAMEATALLGGRDRSLAASLAEAIRGRGFDVVSERSRIPKKLRGVHPRNPVNLPPLGGIQIELTPDLRIEPHRSRLTGVLVDALGTVHLPAA